MRTPVAAVWALAESVAKRKKLELIASINANRIAGADPKSYKTAMRDIQNG
jgi:hypothetical protein